MGIETIIFIAVLIIGGSIWGLTRRSRRGDAPGQSPDTSGRTRP